MNWKRLLLIGPPLLLVCLAAAGTWVLLREPDQVRAYHRLRLGMTRSDAIAAIGMAPGDYTSHPTEFDWEVVEKTGLPYEGLIGLITEKQNRVPGSDKRLEGWMWDEIAIAVAFDEDGEVIGYCLLKDGRLSFWDLLRANLSL
jgi:hypothetical protein